MKTTIIMEMDGLVEMQHVLDRLNGLDSRVRIVVTPTESTAAEPASAVGKTSPTPVATPPAVTPAAPPVNNAPAVEPTPVSTVPAVAAAPTPKAPVVAPPSALPFQMAPVAPVKRGRGRPRSVPVPPGMEVPAFVGTTESPQASLAAAAGPVILDDWMPARSAPPIIEGCAATTPVPTLAKLQEAIEAVLAAKGVPVTMAALSRFGVKRARDLREDQRAEFIEYCGAVASGKIDPLTGSGVAS